MRHEKFSEILSGFRENITIKDLQNWNKLGRIVTTFSWKNFHPVQWLNGMEITDDHNADLIAC